MSSTSEQAYSSEAMKMEPMKVEYPVAKTFIQYPTLRNPSLDAFFQERLISSCPASRMNSIEEDGEATGAPCTPIGTLSSLRLPGNEMKYSVKNTFVDFPAWESLRDPSLEEFFQERLLQSCPASRAPSLQASLESAVLISDAMENIGHVENQAMRSISLEECLRDIEDKYQNLEVYDDVISTKANTDEDAAPTPALLSDSEDATRSRTICLTTSLGLWSTGSANHHVGSLGLWSAGSANHHLGTCKPCAFLWKDANGCENGMSCNFCHMCPPGEVKLRKKQKLAMRKMVRNFRQLHNTRY